MTMQQQNTLEKPRFWRLVGKSFETSSYVTWTWEWFLSLAGRLVQPVLFVTVMYNIVTTYPGFKAPWNGLDIIAFIAQNAALDVGSFGLPALADRAEADGNEAGAEKARRVAKALFYILISNLVWGGVEHVFTSDIPDGVKTAVALLFVIVRAYYATEYMRVIHSLGKHAERDAIRNPDANYRDATGIASLIAGNGRVASLDASNDCRDARRQFSFLIFVVLHSRRGARRNPDATCPDATGPANRDATYTQRAQ